jgi:glyoxylase-like metal-dependent hydrolase (beta-lactamase superfamily II)
MSIDYSVPAMRQELVRIDNVRPPLGGGAGGYNPMTFQGGIRPVPGDIIQNTTFDARQPNGAIAFWLTPHGFIKGAMANLATAKTQMLRGKRTVSFTGFGKFPITATIDDRNIIQKVEALVDVAYTGDTVVDGTYTDYRDLDGVRMPMHIVMREGGFPTLELNVTEARPNSDEAVDVVKRVTSAAPARPPAQAAERAEPQPAKLAEGVWQLTPAAEGSVLVEFKDYLVMIEAPGGDANSMASIATAQRLAPNKPIKYVINTHGHFDHAGGLRAFVAEGATIITHQANKGYYEKIFALPHTLNPDKLAQNKAKVNVETIGDKRVLTDGTHTIELYRTQGSLHNEGLVMAYLPKEKILLEADSFNPPAQADAPPPATPTPANVTLLNNISRLKLDVETIVPVHYPPDGRKVTMAELRRAVGQRSTN